MKITKSAVDATQPTAKTQLFWDADLRGFGLKIMPSGTKTYLVQYRMGGRAALTQRFTIGRHGSPWTPAEARKEAERILMQCQTGLDPRAAARERQRQEIDLAFDVYAQRFLTEYGKRRWRPSTYRSAESNMRRWATPVLKRRTISTLRRRDLVEVFDKLPAANPTLPRHMLALLRKMFAWAVDRGDIDINPLSGYKIASGVEPRDRVLSDTELRVAWQATFAIAPQFGTLVRLLMLTGQRRDEVAGMRWEELCATEAAWTLPGVRAKNGRPHVIPLANQVVAELDKIGSKVWPVSGFAISTTGKTAVSGFSRMKSQLDKVIENEAGEPATPWRLHDLRRTLATGLQRLGVRFEVTEAVLNHLSGSRSGVAGVYQRHDWKDEKRAALQRWADHVSALLQET